MTSRPAPAAEQPLTAVVVQEVARRVVGQDAMVERLLIGLLTGGHILLEGVPGLAKTLAVRSLAEAIRTKFSRIQFTPDLLPADIIGTMVFDQRTGEFRPKRGPLFANIVLADEVNRAPAKVQAALLEAMQEKQVTIGGETHLLAEPFLVLATQNPIEQEGTYPLPEAQVDRFMMKLKITYPQRDEEKTIMERVTVDGLPDIEPVVEPSRLKRAQELIRGIYMDEKVKNYILDIIIATREPDRFKLPIKHLIAYGASPRATIFLAQTSKAHAFLRGRGYVTPEDVKAVSADVLRHRVIVTYEAEAEDLDSEAIIRQIFDAIEVP